MDEGENDDSTAALEKKLAGLKARQAASESLTATTGETTHANTPEELIAAGADADQLPAKPIWFQGNEYGAWPMQIGQGHETADLAGCPSVAS